MLHYFSAQRLKCVLTFTLFLILTILTQITLAQVESNQHIDIDSKVNELGITTTELQEILNSALRNDAGNNLQPEALTQIILTGQAAEDHFGSSVSIAGDVNGDGYSDLIVGAPSNDAGGSNTGRAYIYFGGITMDSSADVIMTGEAADDYFGSSVFTAGDVNGDGYSDVIVGAVGNDAGGTIAGRAYIYLGGTSMDSIADVTMTGEAAYDQFGYSVSTAGDVNGDGYSDVIVGAQGNDAGSSYIYLGGTSMDNIADIIMTGEEAGDKFGYSVSTGGDVNGDGYSDVIVGAHGNDAGGDYAGRSYIYFGGTSMDTTADVTMTGEAASDFFGWSVSTAGDVNGDGYSDVIVGTYANSAGGTYAGRAYIYFGGISMDNIAEVTMTGEAALDNFGYSVCTAGDVNGDGYSDVIVGANVNGGANTGYSHIYFGGTPMDSVADVIMTGEVVGDRFGSSVSTAGDVNGDGFSDIIAGAPFNDAGGIDAGRAYIYNNLQTGLPNGLVAYYPFNGNANDESGNGNDGTVDGANLIGDRFGNSNSAYSFDGQDDKIDFGDVTFLDGENEATIALWINYTEHSGDYDPFLTKGPIAQFEGSYTVFYTPGGNHLASHFVEGPGLVSSAGYSNPLDDGEWHFITVTLQNKIVEFYIDGILSTSTQPESNCLVIQDISDPLTVGYNLRGSGENWYNGKIDDIRIYDYALNEVEILALFHEGGWNQAPVPVWTNQIIVENAEGTEASEVLTFGQHPDATDSIDTSLGEYILPPAPPADIFDSRFILPTVPEFGSLIDLRDSSQTEITWTLAFQAGSAGYPMTFSWDSTSFPVGTFYLTDRITGGSLVNVNMKDQSSYVLTISAFFALEINYNGELCSEVSVNNGWNMISVPYLAEDMALSSLFPTATSEAFGFEDYYVAKDTLSTGEGYWLKFGASEGIQICGMPPRDTIQVNAEWNMIGPFEEDIPVSQITTTPPGIIVSNFFGFEVGYNIADTLKAGKGYWVYVTSDGIILLNSGALLKDEWKQIAQIEQNWGRIKITDSEGRGITLYATAEEIESDFYALPPIPPAGIFDARYNTGNFVEDLRSSQIIQISSDSYPISIKVEGIDLTILDKINGEMLNEELTNGEEIRITNSKIKSIVVTGRVTGGLPVSYELYQNYPNPFNPSTKIQFSIPKEVQVNLSIFNILGERVKELKNEMMKPGYYEVELNASALATGVYFYRIVAGDFVETKKMVLMK